mgnify:CR=1 FL=1
MSLDTATVRRVAALARIRLEEEEVARVQGELNGILGWIEQLQAVTMARSLVHSNRTCPQWHPPVKVLLSGIAVPHSIRFRPWCIRAMASVWRASIRPCRG